MLREITYYMIFGKPLIMYMGIITFLSFSVTFTIGLLNYKGIKIIPFKWHPVFAVISITLALLHGIAGILAYF